MKVYTLDTRNPLQLPNPDIPLDCEFKDQGGWHILGDQD